MPRPYSSRSTRRLACLAGVAAAATFAVAAAETAPVAKTIRVSESSTGAESNAANAAYSKISAGGRFTVFESSATTLVTGDSNGEGDVFLHNRVSGKTVRVSVSSAEQQGNGSSSIPAVSASGRFVAFVSDATNLVGGDTNAASDIFVRDRETGKTQRVSVSSAGAQANGGSVETGLSTDGRFVVFDSLATNLVANDENGHYDVFVRDRWKRKTTRVSVSSAGREGNGDSLISAISTDGRFVVFESIATNLVPNDANGADDIFLRDRKLGKTFLISKSSAGVAADAASNIPAVSADGRFVAFESGATNLVPGDTEGFKDIFVRDRKLGKTRRISRSSSGAGGDGQSSYPTISADGRFVAFDSDASDLVAGDTNAVYDVFVRDRRLGKTRRISVRSGGAQSNGDSDLATLSADGRFVIYRSNGTNLVGDDSNGFQDYFQSGPLR